MSEEVKAPLPTDAGSKAPVTKPVDLKTARNKLWGLGMLPWKLDPAQKTLYADIGKARAAGKNSFVLLCSRRWGKTHLMVILGIEEALRTPGAQIALISKTKRSAKDIATKIVQKILDDCPARHKPTFHKQDFRWDFANGSALFFLGCDSGHYEKVRGREFNLIMVDEAGFIDDLQVIVNEVLRPTLLTTNGFMLFASTPPKSPNHPFTAIYRKAQADGAFCLKTIYDNPRLKPAQIEREKEEQGGALSPTWRREYLCDFQVEDSDTVIPEWTHARAYGNGTTPGLVCDVQRPEYCDKYVSLDLGFKDLTVALFGWWDFANARVVIEDELVLKGQETTTAKLASSLAMKLSSLWGDPHEYAGKGEVYQVSDVDPRLIFELRTLHGLNFRQTAKDNKDAAINTLRLMVGQGQVVISPKCVVLIRTLFEATWKASRKEYERTDEIGHADAIDALIYLVRNVRKHRNPGATSHSWLEEHQINRPKPVSGAIKALGACYGAPGNDLRSLVNARLGRRRF